jgi:hypothetical protein
MRGAYGLALRTRRTAPGAPRCAASRLLALATVFQDDDRGFFSWLDDHPDSYFINSERVPKPAYLVLHRHDCSHFDRGTTVHWTKDYIKICCPDRSGLEEWATGTVGGDVTLCRTCFG